MARRYFGTDGIRGRTNEGAMTAETAMRVGRAAGAHFLRGSHRHRVLIGKDTRLSGYMMESALTAGFTSVGMDVVLVGPMPTPAVAMLTRAMRADLGVMISASHNPFADNGIKLFGPDGYKLSDEDEARIEQAIDNPPPLIAAEQIGRARRIDDAQGRYLTVAKSTFPDHLRLDGLRIVIDCANGAAYRVAPTVLWELGAELIQLGVDPDGTNINDKVGSTAPAALQAKVLEVRADLGIALDGDADRLIVVDDRGQVVDGDQLLALIATAAARDGTLKGDGVVATIMSNLGLERFLWSKGIALHRTPVGDRYVVEAMRAGGYNIGGEQSGHIVLADCATTGDGLIAALKVLAELVQTGQPAHKILKLFDPLPQLLKNVRFSGGQPLEDDAVKASIAAAEKELGERGRLVIRKSGTEPLIRVMAEGEDDALVAHVVDRICDAVRKAA